MAKKGMGALKRKSKITTQNHPARARCGVPKKKREGLGGTGEKMGKSGRSKRILFRCKEEPGPGNTGTLPPWAKKDSALNAKSEHPRKV